MKDGGERSGDVELLGKQTVCKSHYRIDQYRFRNRKFDGSWSEPVKRDVFERGHAVGVLLYDPDRDQVVLIEQFRIGAYAAGRVNPWYLEVVAGIFDEGETAEDVARREAKEEANCDIGRLEQIQTYVVSPGGSSESVVLFCGSVDSSNAGGVHGLDDEHEDIKVHVLPADEAIRLADEDVIDNAVTLIALHWFARHREALRRRWLEAARSHASPSSA